MSLQGKSKEKDLVRGIAMAKSPRCLYESKLQEFLNRDKE